MFYFKSREQVAGEAIGGIIGLFIRLTIWSMIYSPFVFAFGYTYLIAQRKFNFHWLVCSILGLLAAALLFFVIGFIYAAQQDLKNNQNKIWVPLSFLNLTLIAGFPFFIGMSFGLDILDKNTASLFEKILAGGFGGCVLAIPAYLGVTKHFPTETINEKP